MLIALVAVAAATTSLRAGHAQVRSVDRAMTVTTGSDHARLRGVAAVLADLARDLLQSEQSITTPARSILGQAIGTINLDAVGVRIEHTAVCPRIFRPALRLLNLPPPINA